MKATKGTLKLKLHGGAKESDGCPCEIPPILKSEKPKGRPEKLKDAARYTNQIYGAVPGCVPPAIHIQLHGSDLKESGERYQKTKRRA